jgi:hypothetical protein
VVIDWEVHSARADDNWYGWDDGANVWNILNGPSSIPDATGGAGGSGATKGKVAIDTDKALAIAAGILGLNLNGTTLSMDGSGLQVDGLPSQFEIGGSAVAATVDQAALDILTGGVASDADGEHTHDGLAAGSHSHDHDTDLTGISANDHHDEVHALVDMTNHPETGLTDGHALMADSATTYSFQALPISDEAKAVENDYTVGAAGVTKGDPVYVSANDTVLKCDAANDNTRKFIGTAKTTQTVGQTVSVIKSGVIVAPTVAGAAAAGNFVYVKGGGGLTVTMPATSGDHKMVVGKMKNATDVDLGKDQYLGKVR